MVDSIFYGNILKFNNKGSSIYINQFFEYGAFNCYFRDFIWNIYNEFDVAK